MATDEPMSARWVDTIAKEIETAFLSLEMHGDVVQLAIAKTARTDLRFLCAEYNRLRAELAAAQATIARLRPVVERMAALGGDGLWYLTDDECAMLAEQARAALAEGEVGQ